MIALLCSFLLAGSQSVMPDSLRTDTLAEVVVHGGASPVSKAIGQRIEAWKKSQPKQVNLTTLFDLIHSELNDILMHPFGFKQRKKERRRKRTRQILEHYDRVKTPNEQLREAIEREKQREVEGK